MTDHFLIIDTESSGLPKNWTLPYDAKDNWPHVLQVSWVVYDADGNQVKQEDHYLQNDGFRIEDSSREIHGITDHFLAEKGETKAAVLARLRQDFLRFRPLVIGHFIELDYRLLAAEYFRLGESSPFDGCPMYCTMKGAALLPDLPGRNWKLTDLYRYFFNEDQPHPHNALCDALATAKCFFRERELLHVPPDYFYRQNPVILYDRYRYNTKRIGIVLVVFICLLLVIFFLSFR